MSKTSQSIKMLQLLCTKKVYKTKELADLLETNERNIVEYKKELELAGYYIQGIKGPDGGYSIDKNEFVPSPKLKKEEQLALSEALDYINHRYDFLKTKEFNMAIGKIFSTTSDIYKKELDEIYIDRFPLVMPKEELRYRYDLMANAIKNKNAVLISYLNSKNEVKERKIHPYFLFNYNMSSYVLAYIDFGNKLSSDPLYFKLNRIINYKMLNEKFIPIKTFDSKKYLDSYGMKNNGDYYDIKILLKSPYAALIKERVYGKNQEVIPIDSSTTILKCKMQNKENIVSFILGFGSKATVLEPKEIKDAVKEEIDRMRNIYENDNF